MAFYLKKTLPYNYKHNFSKNTESIFNNIFLPKGTLIVVGILYRSPDKNNFIKKLEQKITGFSISEKQECYLLGDFNSNILHKC